ncbi:uncharacterized protein LOC107711635 [Sinocyclocheilus rhinocerous]|uniref:uncharacterized protein LOC107711635 n=1 Tax=Sinocyclocheilus rhinocerous TaxID=307959 RepID=UPI0007B84A1B|nr:PREDICTED: uncharacterized protein LOC107711635 [Sinocyclocheilus rhinocerous]
MNLLLGTCLGLLFNFVDFNTGADMIAEEKKVFLGGRVSLRCLNLLTQTDCSNVTWLSNDDPAIELVTLGKRNPDSSQREGRVSLMSDCSLHISELGAGDNGCYTCRQYSGLHGSKIGEDARICLIINKAATSMNNNDSTDDREDLLMIIIPSVLIVGALSVTALIIWLRYHRRAQMRTSVENQNILEFETKITEHEHKNGEDVNYIELNHNVMKPRKMDIDKVADIDQKTEYAVIKLC